MMLRGGKGKYSSAPLTERILEDLKWQKFWHTVEQIAFTIVIVGIGFGAGVWYAMNLMAW